MPVVTPTKSGHDARRRCGHTCVVYAINPGIHAPPSIFTTAHAHPPLTNARGHIQIGGMGPRSFQQAHRAPRLHGPRVASNDSGGEPTLYNSPLCDTLASAVGLLSPPRRQGCHKAVGSWGVSPCCDEGDRSTHMCGSLHGSLLFVSLPLL